MFQLDIYPAFKFVTNILVVQKKHTIKDIAKLAGVSKGTVDRVLHKRGKVSEKALKKVEQVLEEIEYRPNPIARNLKNNKTYRICVLIPDTSDDPYWAPGHQGIIEAAREYGPFGVLVEECIYHAYSKSSFVDEAEKAVKSRPDAILIAPLFQEESRKILEKCKKLGILVVLFNNYIGEFKGEIFIGQDLMQTGRVAASLIHKIVCSNALVGVIHVDMEPHMQLKEKGFSNYFDAVSDEITIVAQAFETECEDEFRKQVKQFINENPNLEALFITNSKAYKVLEVLNGKDLNIVVLGYDLLEKNIHYLKKDKIDFLIHQKPKQQAYLSIEYLAEHFLFGKKIPKKKLLPIDIITSQNVLYHLDETHFKSPRPKGSG